MNKAVWGSVFFAAAVVAVILVSHQVLAQRSSAGPNLEEADVLFIG